ncbi:hypothetical protein BH09MYX1_BH09MYX1_11980 [soil metagenome]
MIRLFPASSVFALAVLLGACSDPAATPGPSADGGESDASSDVRSDGEAPLCANGQSVDGVYPKRAQGFKVGTTLPDLELAGIAADGTERKLALHEWFEPCATETHVLVLRVSAGFCGTCRWHAKRDLLENLDIGGRITTVDVVVADDDNFDPALSDAKLWRARTSVAGAVMLDAKYQLDAFHEGIKRAIPFYVVIDRRTMKAVTTLDDPAPGLLQYKLRNALNTIERTLPAPPPLVEEKLDGWYSRDQWEMIQEITLPGAPPADPTNAKADDPAAAAMGKTLFNDPKLSPSGTFSCATCHVPAKRYQDGLPQSQGAWVTLRHSPSALLASHARWQFWDGRADTLWAQALGPTENEREMSSSRLFIAHEVFNRYKTSYEAIFGALPDLFDAVRFPASGKPGVPAYDGMTAPDKDAVTRVFVNVGKSIAAFERTLRVKPTKIDAYVAGDTNALAPLEKHGLHEFFVAGCAMCHYGPRLTDDAFHNVRFPTGRDDALVDTGRIDGITSLLASDFLASGKYSDDPTAAHGLTLLSAIPRMLGAMKTPTLRGVATDQPFGHGGTVATLADVVKIYQTGGLAEGDLTTTGAVDPWLNKFDDPTREAIPVFLQTLEGEVAP